MSDPRVLVVIPAYHESLNIAGDVSRPLPLNTNNCSSRWRQERRKS